MASAAGGDRDGDIALIREALELEEAAVRRYVEHAAATSDPRLQTYWESLRRNEAGHRGLLEAELARLGAAPNRPRVKGDPGAGGP
jgi:rubrerythrin